MGTSAPRLSWSCLLVGIYAINHAARGHCEAPSRLGSQPTGRPSTAQVCRNRGNKWIPIGLSNVRHPAERACAPPASKHAATDSEHAATDRATAGHPDRETHRCPMPVYAPTANRAVADADGCLAPITRAGDRPPVTVSGRPRAAQHSHGEHQPTSHTPVGSR
jgi:hypothetical protein